LDVRKFSPSFQIKWYQSRSDSFADCEYHHGKRIEVSETSRVGRNQPMHSSRECRAQKDSTSCRRREARASREISASWRIP
jgi:hypothetical protein